MVSLNFFEKVSCRVLGCPLHIPSLSRSRWVSTLALAAPALAGSFDDGWSRSRSQWKGKKKNAKREENCLRRK